MIDTLVDNGIKDVLLAKAVTPDGYFGAPNLVDPELWRHFDLTARAMSEALVRERK